MNEMKSAGTRSRQVCCPPPWPHLAWEEPLSDLVELSVRREEVIQETQLDFGPIASIDQLLRVGLQGVEECRERRGLVLQRLQALRPPRESKSVVQYVTDALDGSSHRARLLLQIKTFALQDMTDGSAVVRGGVFFFFFLALSLSLASANEQAGRGVRVPQPSFLTSVESASL